MDVCGADDCSDVSVAFGARRGDMEATGWPQGLHGREVGWLFCGPGANESDDK